MLSESEELRLWIHHKESTIKRLQDENNKLEMEVRKYKEDAEVCKENFQRERNKNELSMKNPARMRRVHLEADVKRYKRDAENWKEKYKAEKNKVEAMVQSKSSQIEFLIAQRKSQFESLLKEKNDEIKSKEMVNKEANMKMLADVTKLKSDILEKDSLINNLQQTMEEVKVELGTVRQRTQFDPNSIYTNYLKTELKKVREINALRKKQPAVATLKFAIKKKISEISSLKSENGNLNSKIAGLERIIHSLNEQSGRIVDLENQVKSYKQILDKKTIETDFNKLRQDFENGISALQRKLLEDRTINLDDVDELEIGEDIKEEMDL